MRSMGISAIDFFLPIILYKFNSLCDILLLGTFQLNLCSAYKLLEFFG